MPPLSAEFYFRDPQAPVPNAPSGLGVAVLLRRDASLLLERRSDCGKWGLVGGALEASETIVEALEREVFEETGLTIDSYALFGLYSDPSRIGAYPDGNVRRIITVAFVADVPGEVRMHYSHESLDLRFFSIEELPDLDIVATHRQVVSDYINAGDSRRPLVH